jgi:hypothetical protein
MRFRVALVLNLLVPGGGLVMLQREWLGLTVAVLFVVLAQIGVFGLWIVPVDVPRWQAGSALGAAGLVWAAAQVLAWTRFRAMTSPDVQRDLVELRTRASAAMAAKDWTDAHCVLLLALNLDDEDVHTVALWAELMGHMGHRRDARRGWKRVQSMDRAGQYRHAVEAALAAL